MIEQNKSVAKRWLDEFWTAGDLAVADELFSVNYVRHDPEGKMIGPDVVRGYVHFIAEDMIAEGDRVVVRWTATGTHIPTNRQVTFPGMDILRLLDGKIIESWPCFDRKLIELQLSGKSQPD